jgi:hypothetical protein
MVALMIPEELHAPFISANVPEGDDPIDPNIQFGVSLQSEDTIEFIQDGQYIENATITFLIIGVESIFVTVTSANNEFKMTCAGTNSLNYKIIHQDEPVLHAQQKQVILNINKANFIVQLVNPPEISQLPNATYTDTLTFTFSQTGGETEEKEEERQTEEEQPEKRPQEE